MEKQVEQKKFFLLFEGGFYMISLQKAKKGPIKKVTLEC